MTIDIPTGGSVRLKAVYRDASGAVTTAPVGSTLSWTMDTPDVASLDTTTAAVVTETAVGAAGTTTNLSVTDGTLTSTPVALAIVAGEAKTLNIEPDTDA